MNPSSLKLEFEKQLKECDVKISQAEEQLTKLKEYKIKLQGGLETLELLSSNNEEQEETQNAPSELTTPVFEE